MVWDRRPERDAGARDRHAGAAHSCEQDDPDVQRSLADSGLEPLKESPEQFGVRIRRDHERFRDIVKAAKLKPE